jgi:hypothetical protein
MPKVNIRPIGENSPNLVTLAELMKTQLRKMFQNFSPFFGRRKMSPVGNMYIVPLSLILSLFRILFDSKEIYVFLFQGNLCTDFSEMG